jgi:hypothetical protein
MKNTVPQVYPKDQMSRVLFRGIQHIRFTSQWVSGRTRVLGVESGGNTEPLNSNLLRSQE